MSIFTLFYTSFYCGSTKSFLSFCCQVYSHPLFVDVVGGGDGGGAVVAVVVGVGAVVAIVVEKPFLTIFYASDTIYLFPYHPTTLNMERLFENRKTCCQNNHKKHCLDCFHLKTKKIFLIDL